MLTVCVSPPDQTNCERDLKHPLPMRISKCFVSKKTDPEGHKPWKTVASHGFLHISLIALFLWFHDFLETRWPLHMTHFYNKKLIHPGCNCPYLGSEWPVFNILTFLYIFSEMGFNKSPTTCQIRRVVMRGLGRLRMW